jgi:hypothetical protein
MKSLTRIAVVTLALALSACATIVSAPAGPYKVANGYTVDLGRQWSDISGTVLNRGKKVRLLSIDGPLLNRLYLIDGLAPGDFIVKPASKQSPTPIYRSGMSPTELVEFVTDSAAAMDYQRIETSGLRPVTFAGGEGMRFDLAAQTTGGLEMAGTAVVAERSGKLYVSLYLAPREHYYEVYLPEVEKVFGSARFG